MNRYSFSAAAFLLSAVLATAADPGFRVVTVTDSSIPLVRAAIHYATVIRFPADEEIESVFIGDGTSVAPGQVIEALPAWEFWPVRNTVSVKPTLKGSRTSMVVNSKDKYGVAHTTSFELVESGGVPDISVQVDRDPPPPDPNILLVKNLRFQVDQKESQIADLERSLASARSAAEKEKQWASNKVDPETYASQIHADYILGKGADKPPFLVKQVFNDGMTTKIDCASLEPPSFYELKDGKPSLVEYTFKSGRYTIPKIVDNGILRVGKKQITFRRESPYDGTASTPGASGR